jgi:PBP1b-binding outer membrane lipoprotein LpoB
MKTKIVLLAILASAVLMSACVGIEHLGVFDESVPEEQQCFLEVRNNLSVILFNNKPVNWSPGFAKDKMSIYVPPGENTFMVTYVVQRSIGNNLYVYDTISNTVGMEFLPGRSYRIYKQEIWLVFFTMPIVKIKEVPSR